jgi:4-alpha-glucanotransferase
MSNVHHDGFARFPVRRWKGAGVAIPVFSLRTHNSWGVGEFTDIPLLADWAKHTGLRLLQLLPINDTTATHTWTDSYPYAAISAFALHPIFINVEQLAGKKHASVLKPYLKKQKELNVQPAVDYEGVMQTKWDILRQLYDLQKADWIKDTDYQTWYQSNQHWLAPYAAFCWLRDANSTSDFGQWSKHSVYKPAEIDKLLDPKHKSFDQIGLHLFVQWHLHLQLKAAVDYAHGLGLSLKGDIPIGIYRYSCDAWVAPELYNMNAQAGAPPDDFAEKGQNWGFPTYNWARMKADGFAWWKQRFEQMSLYFDAFRIDHILGFFRIWSIPMDAVEGILGQFVPAIPVTEAELRQAGAGFDYDRYCKPYITEQVLHQLFGGNAAQVVTQFLQARPDGRYAFKPEFDTQRKVEAWMNAQKPSDFLTQVREGVYELQSNVILMPAPEGYAFRFGIEKTSSFQHLPEGVKAALKNLYVNYFYRRQDDFWQREAMEKLPALKAATQMLICGEDLGMVPACVPDVMEALGILSLEIQRMPKATGITFFHPKDAPYLSVVTPSTHDMSTIRGWWEEDRSLTQRFYNEILQRPGDAPYFCEAWVNRIILEQHFHSPAMWAIFQLQDLLGMDAALRRENPADERINIPANPKHYWRYRAHIALEDLLKAEGFNAGVRRLVDDSGRGGR